jgi:drug/metabolite transporter (DMT)-like permease
MAVTAAGFLVLSAWLLATGTPLRIVWPSLWLVAASGAILALATLFLFAALALGPISIVAPVAGSYPAFAMLFALAAGNRPDAVEWMAIAAVMLGVAAVAQSGGGASAAMKPGALKSVVALSLLASFCFASSVTAGQAAVPIFGEAQSVWLARIFGLLTVALIYLRPSVRWQAPGRWLPVLGLMGALDVIAFLSVVTAGGMPDAALATVTSSAFGAVTVVLARIFLKEQIVPLQLSGIVLIFGGVAVLASR